MLKFNRLKLLLGSLLFAAGLNAPAANLVWTNTLGGNWTTAANWSPNTVPTAADSAYLTNGGTYTITLSVGATVSGLSLGADTLSGVRGGALSANQQPVCDDQYEFRRHLTGGSDHAWFVESNQR